MSESPSAPDASATGSGDVHRSGGASRSRPEASSSGSACMPRPRDTRHPGSNAPSHFLRWFSAVTLLSVRRFVAPAFALVVLAFVVFGFAVVAGVGQAVSDGAGPPPWQAFALPSALALLAAVLAGGTLMQLRRSRRR